jgi:hypothetical protein
MKNISIVFFLLFTASAYSQIDDSLAKNFRLDFAIPDHPAFNIIDNNDDKILRPSNSQEIFSFVYSNFFNGTAPFIPKNFSIEFSPGQLIGIKKITLDDYMKDNSKRILYDIKFSLGAKLNDQDSLRNLAAGLRIPWIDKTSLLNNPGFVKDMFKSLRSTSDLRSEFIDSLRIQGVKFNGLLISPENIAADEELERHVDSLFQDYSRKTPRSLQSIRTKYKDANWNKLKFETALAVRYSSQDSLFQNIHYTKFIIWNTLAFPLRNWGQGLLGLNISNEKNDSLNSNLDTIKYSYTNFTFSSRFYAGSNNLKAFLEGSLKYNSSHFLQPSVNIGAELNITNGLWAVINFGNNWLKNTKLKTNWESSFYWKLDLRFHLPEKKHI